MGDIGSPHKPTSPFSHVLREVEEILSGGSRNEKGANWEPKKERVERKRGEKKKKKEREKGRGEPKTWMIMEAEDEEGGGGGGKREEE